MLRLLARTTGRNSIPVAGSAHRSQMTLQTPRSFNAWLRSQLKEKKMSQRQLALQSGVDHSTISRLIKGDRMPSLGTATKLARGLREIDSVHSRSQHHIGQQHVRRLAAFQDWQRGLRGIREQHLVPERCELTTHGAAHGRFVFDNQDGVRHHGRGYR